MKTMNEEEEIIDVVEDDKTSETDANDHLVPNSPFQAYSARLNSETDYAR